MAYWGHPRKQSKSIWKLLTSFKIAVFFRISEKNWPSNFQKSIKNNWIDGKLQKEHRNSTENFGLWNNKDTTKAKVRFGVPDWIVENCSLFEFYMTLIFVWLLIKKME